MNLNLFHSQLFLLITTMAQNGSQELDIHCARLPCVMAQWCRAMALCSDRISLSGASWEYMGGEEESRLKCVGPETSLPKLLIIR